MSGQSSSGCRQAAIHSTGWTKAFLSRSQDKNEKENLYFIARIDNG